MEFLRSFLRRHLAGKPVVASRNIGCFRRLSSFELGYIDRGRLLIELDEHVELEELVLSSVSLDNGYDPFT